MKLIDILNRNFIKLVIFLIIYWSLKWLYFKILCILLKQKSNVIKRKDFGYEVDILGIVAFIDRPSVIRLVSETGSRN